MGSAGISLTPLPPLEVSAWLGEAMPPGKGVGVGVGVGVVGGKLLSGMTGGGGGMKDGVGDGVRTAGGELGSTTGREVAEGGGAGTSGSGVDVAFVTDEMTNVVRGRPELKGTGGGGGEGVGLGEAVGVFCLAGGADDDDDNGGNEPVGAARLGPVDCAPVAPLSVFGVPVPAPVRPKRGALLEALRGVPAPG